MNTIEREQLARRLLLGKLKSNPISSNSDDCGRETYEYMNGVRLSIAPKWDGRLIYKEVECHQPIGEPKVYNQYQKEIEYKDLTITYDISTSPEMEDSLSEKNLTKLERKKLAKLKLLACQNAKIRRQCIGEWGAEVYEYDNGQKITISPYWDGGLWDGAINDFSYRSKDTDTNNYINDKYNSATENYIEESWRHITITTHLQGLLNFYDSLLQKNN